MIMVSVFRVRKITRVYLDCLETFKLKANANTLSSNAAIFYDKTNKTILKPIFDVRGVREEVFYRLLFDPKHDTDPSLVQLRSFIPVYLGSQPINGVDFVTLSDLTADFANPSLMDVKIGVKTYDRNATEEKISHESTKNYLNKVLGFRVLAVKVCIHSVYYTV